MFCLLIAHFTISYFLIHLTVEITLLNISLSVICLQTFAVQPHNSTSLHGFSFFFRKLGVQLRLDTERIEELFQLAFGGIGFFRLLLPYWCSTGSNSVKKDLYQKNFFITFVLQLAALLYVFFDNRILLVCYYFTPQSLLYLTKKVTPLKIKP